MPNIIIRNYEHYNRAMGCYVKSKADYENKMREGGYVPYEEAQALVEKHKEERAKSYKNLSPKAKAIIEAAKASADKKGKVKLSGRMVDAMKSIGAIPKTDYSKYLPSKYSDKGGLG